MTMAELLQAEHAHALCLGVGGDVTPTLTRSHQCSLLLSIELDSRAWHDRYSVEDTCSLLRDMGIRDTSAFEANGITGADLLDLEEDDLRSELGLSKLQVGRRLMLLDLRPQRPFLQAVSAAVPWHPRVCAWHMAGTSGCR